MFVRKESELKSKFCDTDNASNTESEGCMGLVKFQVTLEISAIMEQHRSLYCRKKGAASRKEPVRSICTCLREMRRNLDLNYHGEEEEGTFRKFRNRLN